MKPISLPAPAAQFWRAPERAGVEFARITYDTFAFDPHFHEHYVIMLVEAGVNLGRRCNDSYEVLPGEMLVIEPGEMHTGSSLEGRRLTYLAFYPGADFVERWLGRGERGSSRPPGFELHYRRPELRRAFLRLFGSVAAGDRDVLGRDAAFVEFFETLRAAQPGISADSAFAPAADRVRFERAAADLRDRFAESLTLDELAEAADTSPFHLIRLFRRHAGLTPFAYLRSVRVERAKHMLRSGASITEVAHATGFCDQSHFIRTFKRTMGVLPSHYRAAVAGRRT